MCMVCGSIFFLSRSRKAYVTPTMLQKRLKSNYTRKSKKELLLLTCTSSARFIFLLSTSIVAFAMVFLSCESFILRCTISRNSALSTCCYMRKPCRNLFQISEASGIPRASCWWDKSDTVCLGSAFLPAIGNAPTYWFMVEITRCMQGGISNRIYVIYCGTL